MTWAEVLATFNFVAWLLPIIVRTWMAWKYGNSNGAVLSTEEHQLISKAVGRISFGGKRLKVGHDSEGTGNSEKGSQ